MSEYTHYDHIHMPLTIERQLMAYKSHPDHDVQHEVLWTTWCHNKRMLEQLLRWTLVSFPMYSRHDESHSTSVLRNMERILGENRIKLLSATDCFALLHVSYEHDIGMCITNADRERIIEDQEFLEMLEVLSHGADPMLASYAQLIKGCCSDKDRSGEGTLTEQEKYRRALKKNLNIYHAMTELLTMYQRTEHGKIARRRIQDTLASQKSRLSEPFNVSDISPRIFYWIAECAALHTVWEFNEILDLPFEDDGAASDKLHPRFIAVMLQLGDALDMDGGRFPLLMEEFYGKLSSETKKHLKKHEAIRMLCINDRKIEVRANCEDHGVSRLIQAECRGIDDILRNASYHWSEIAPEDVPGMLPSFELSEMTVKGTKIPPQLINASFKISQKKAFSLLEGSNIYMNKLVFLREILQNAFDASKMQYWKDYLGRLSSRSGGFGDGDAPPAKKREGNEVLFEAAQQLSLEQYRVLVKLTVCAVTEENTYIAPASAIKADCIMKDFGGSSCHDFGIRVEVQDCGIGISEKDLSYIADLGTESREKQQLKSSMPDVLCPTGSFGIGLQSIFLAADHFHMRTRTRTGEAYDVRFSSMTGSEEGIINTTSVSDAHTLPFGTKVTVNVSSQQRNTDPSVFEEARVSYDPFVATEAEKKLHEAEELLAQMVMYLNEILGERLFPLGVQLENLFSRQQHPWLGQILENPRDLHFDLSYTLTDPVKDTAVKTYTPRNPAPGAAVKDIPPPVPPLSWALRREFQEKPNCFRGRLENGDRYWFDLEEGKLHIWCNEVGAFAAFSASRFCEMMRLQKDSGQQHNIPLYYKGIKMSEAIPFARNLDLLEFVDLKSKHTASILQLNRYYLTEEGKAFFSQTVGSAVMQTVRRVFLHMAGDPYEPPAVRGQRVNKLFEEIYGVLETSIQRACDLKDPPGAREISKIDKRVTSIILLLFLGKMLLYSDLVVDYQTCGTGVIRPIEECPWDCALKKANEFLYAPITNIKSSNEVNTSLRKILVLRRNLPFLWVTINSWRDNGLSDNSSFTTLAELFSSSHKYAVFSLESSSGQEDVKYRMLQLDGKTAASDDLMQKAARSAMQVFTSLNRANNQDTANIQYQERLAAWLVQNIPVSQFFTQYFIPSASNAGASSYEGYWYKFRVLQVSSVRWIRTDMQTQYRLLKRLEAQSPEQGNVRFATVVWSEDFYCLTVPQKAVQSMCTAYPGPVPAYALPKMLLPFDAKQLKKLMSQRMDEILDRTGDHSPDQSEDLLQDLSKASVSQCFAAQFNKYQKIRKQLITMLSDSYRLRLDDWGNELQKTVWEKAPHENLLHSFLELELEPGPEWDGAQWPPIQLFQRCLREISNEIRACEGEISKAADAAYEALRNEQDLKSTFFGKKENWRVFTQMFYYGWDLLKLILSDTFARQYQGEIKAWRVEPATVRLADYVAKHSVNHISHETAHALNEMLYRQTIKMIAYYSAAEFMSGLKEF